MNMLSVFAEQILSLSSVKAILKALTKKVFVGTKFKGGQYLADPGEARGCSANTFVIN